jgi:uncharacterized protein (TIGR04255 family)
MPAIHIRYERPPITEAVIDIRVELPDQFKVETLDRIREKIATDYPTHEELNEIKGSFTLGASAKSIQRKLGYRDWSHDKMYVLQARMNGFTFSRMPPYEHWEPFRSEARRLWDIYWQVVKPARVSRVAIRYINRIDVPTIPIELSEYFRTFPEISRALPQTMSGYVMQLLIPQEDFGGMLSLIEATAPAPKEGVTSVNLDIDLFKEGTGEFDSEEKIWDLIEYLRDKKDEVFEGCITDKTRDLFGPVKK